MKHLSPALTALVMTTSVVGVCSFAPPAAAVVRGQRVITEDTTLTDDQYGGIVIGADGVTLDCDHRQVHISSWSKVNCGDRKCGIVVADHDNVTIKNCDVVGGEYHAGIFINGASGVTLENVYSATWDMGIFIGFSTDITVSALHAAYGEYGVYMQYTSNTAFSDVLVEDVQVGVHSFSTRRSSWLRLAVLGAAGDGYHGSHDSELMISESEFYSNEGSGIWLSGARDGELNGNRTYDNLVMGLALNNVRGFQITGNLGAFNSKCDVLEAPGSSNTWTNNSFRTFCGPLPPYL